MSDPILLLALGLFFATFLTVVGARLLDHAAWRPAPPLWFGLVSLSTPVFFLLFQFIVIAFILNDPHPDADRDVKWSMYFRHVVFEPALKLWACGAVCTAALLIFRRASTDDRQNEALTQNGLLNAGRAVAVAIVLPLAMEFWIDTGEVNWRFLLITLGCAFFAGLLPVLLLRMALVRATGAATTVRYAEAVVALYATIIVWRTYAWHHAVASRPGANAVLAFGSFALGGILVGWFALRRDNRSAAASA